MDTFLLECAVRGALVALGAAVVLRALRIKTAALQHAVWTAVVLTMLALPVWMAGGLKVSLPILRPVPAAMGSATVDLQRTTPEAPAVTVPETASPVAPVGRDVARSVNLQDVLAGAYVLGALGLFARLILGTVQAHRLRRSAVTVAGRLTSRRCTTPITVGWFTPALILPPDWPQWPAAKLAAVLTHEAEHARRHDPLAQWLALLNRAVFWFHPLSWWLERRLAMLAEEACDAAVIGAGHSPEDYSDYLLDLARSVTRKGRRLNVVGMAMPGSGLTERMRQIFDGVPPTPVSRTRVVATAALCAASTLLFAATDVTTLNQQTPDAARPAFDVVSVKPCDRNTPGQSRGGGGGPITSPGRLYLQCYPLSTMVEEAYLYFADGRAHGLSSTIDVGVEGEPDWMQSERYTIEAKTGPTAPAAVMRGPMLQTVLEDRFKLKTRRVTREMPVYELVAAKSGAKVSPYTGHDCVIRDVAVWPPAALPAGQRYCGDRSRIEGGLFIREGVMTLDELASLLRLDQPVVNKTGITAPVSYRVEFAKEDSAGGEAPRPSWLNALRSQLGLDLRPSKGPRDFLVIDHVERPTPNEQVGVFDVASVKECGSGASPGGRSGGGGSNSPGYLFLNCLTLKQLVNMSSGHADDKLNILLRYRLENEFYPVVGGPSWVETDLYTIEARAGGVLDRSMLTGPMLRALLADRFQLKTHAATKDVAVYLLKVADGGLTIKPIDPESCYELDPAKLPLPPGTLQNRHTCGIMSRMWGPFRMTGAKLGTPPKAAGSSLADQLSPLMDRAVLDRTGLDGRYDIEFAYTPDERTPGYYHQTPARNPDMEAILAKRRQPETPEAANGPNIFKALEKIGLRLEPVKVAVPYLVIDSAQRPRPDFAAQAATSGRPAARK